jgi:hypothetical protein
MPILDVEKAKTVLFVKRGMALGLCRRRERAVLPRQHHDAVRRREKDGRGHQQGARALIGASAPAVRRVIGFSPLLIVYAAAMAALWYWQRSLVFPGARSQAVEFHSRVNPDPRDVGLTAFTSVVVETPDGERLRAWWRSPDAGRPAILFLHGNGGSIADRAPRARL